MGRAERRLQPSRTRGAKASAAIRRASSGEGAAIVQPAARRCPPPPNFAQTDAQSKSPFAREDSLKEVGSDAL